MNRLHLCSQFLILSVIILMGSFTRVSFADVDSKYEPQYAEAILAFNGKDYNQALQILDELVKMQPDTPEFLELKALTLKILNKPGSSAKTYRQLIAQKKKQKAPFKEIAPYYFELGVLHFNNKKPKGANKYFKLAAKGKFNPGPTHFFLGMIAFQNSDWASSITNFNKVVDANAKDLLPASHFYLAQSYFKIKYINGATDSLLRAKDQAESILNNKEASESSKKMAKQIFDASKKALAPLNKSRWFGNVSFISGFDTNILSVPGDTATSGATDLSSLKQVIQVSVGRMGSPTKSIQVTPSYRMSVNWNLNEQARSYEYLSNRLSFYFAKNPLSRFSYGLKTEGIFTFANGSSTGRFSYGYYSTTGEFGPFFKKIIGQGKTVGSELFWGPNVYAGDSALSAENQKNGSKFNLRTYYQVDRGKRYWNPTVSLNASYTLASGSDNKNYELSLSLTDLMYLTQKLKLAIRAAYVRTAYPNRSPESRTDNEINFSTSLTYRWKPRWTVLGSLGYENNISSLPSTYSYSKFLITVGMSYRLL